MTALPQFNNYQSLLFDQGLTVKKNFNEIGQKDKKILALFAYKNEEKIRPKVKKR